MTGLEGFFQDLRHTLRQFRKRPRLMQQAERDKQKITPSLAAAAEAATGQLLAQGHGRHI